jgi:hypothetical protein
MGEGEGEAERVSLDELLVSPEAYSGCRVITAGRLLSASAFEFWLIPGKDDIPTRRGVRLVHPDLDVLLFENVPALGGSYSFYHPAVVAGVVRLAPARSPGVELGQLSSLVITIGGNTYEPLKIAPDAEPGATPDR